MKWKYLLLLMVIYVCFIALGLPDALLGSAWNLVRADLNTSLGSLGLMTVSIYAATTLATFNAPRILRFLETRWITVVSITFTGLGLIGISQINEYYQMLFFALPLGVGAGAIDLSLNHYLATNYKAHHMNFLHSFYGIGITFGPSIMAYTLQDNSWRLGYIIVGSILLGIATLVAISFPIWNKQSQSDRDEQHAYVSTKAALGTKGVVVSVLIFLFYVHIESLGGAWIASYYYVTRGVTYSMAALFTSVYFLSFTIGRLSSGFLSTKIHPLHLIRGGELMMLIGGILMILPISSPSVLFGAVAIFGLGCAPIYPNLMYLNSEHFEKNKISKIMSLQMGVSYMGFGILTPLAGLIFDLTTIHIYPYLIVAMTVLITVLTVTYHRQTTRVVG